MIAYISEFINIINSNLRNCYVQVGCIIQNRIKNRALVTVSEKSPFLYF